MEHFSNFFALPLVSTCLAKVYNLGDPDAVLVGTMEYFRAKVYFTNGTATEHLLLPHQFQSVQIPSR